MPCFYTPELKEQDSKIMISGEEYHHIIDVFRKSIESEILLTNGKGLLAKTKITSINKKKLTVSILSINKEKQSQPKIAVAFSILKNKHDFLIIEKLTELGIKEFFPIITDRTVRKPSKNTTIKFKKTAIAAIKQCDNSFLPKVNNTTSLTEFLVNIKENYKPVVALEVGENRQLWEVLSSLNEENICLVIGPEGGFTNEEIEIFKDKNIQAFNLGNHIVRAETAAIAASAQLLGYFLKKNPEYY
ncbi:MAG: 16S rRNA (uracil(1498)-N(3))-methyltransferase [Armatimonadetes bacterium]|nr:16S rRNA (uracil(1498)-N(3))-methyltransferase [Armatimonadota bacterium]